MDLRGGAWALKDVMSRFCQTRTCAMRIKTDGNVSMCTNRSSYCLTNCLQQSVWTYFPPEYCGIAEQYVEAAAEVFTFQLAIGYRGQPY
eukprot:166076-Rhodomonas_salina.2